MFGGVFSEAVGLGQVILVTYIGFVIYAKVTQRDAIGQKVSWIVAVGWPLMDALDWVKTIDPQAAAQITTLQASIVAMEAAAEAQAKVWEQKLLDLQNSTLASIIGKLTPAAPVAPAAPQAITVHVNAPEGTTVTTDPPVKT